MRKWVTVALMGLLAAGCVKPEVTNSQAPVPTPSPPSPSAAATVSPSPSVSPTPRPSPIDKGLGTFARVAEGETSVFGDAGSLVSYCVRIEDGIESFGAKEFAAVVDTALADSRGWIAVKRWRFQRIADCESAKLRVNLATPTTVDRNCAGAAQTAGKWSCHNNHSLHINLDRWKYGVAHVNGDNLPAYRVMVINHEIGHALGFNHMSCPGPGKTAPIMLPQSRGLNGCVFNPYPYPDGVRYVS